VQPLPGGALIRNLLRRVLFYSKMFDSQAFPRNKEILSPVVQPTAHSSHETVFLTLIPAGSRS
jgi:hypothetical protein